MWFSLCWTCFQSQFSSQECTWLCCSNLNYHCTAVTVNLILLLVNFIVLYCNKSMLFRSRNCLLLVCVTPLELCSSVSPSAAPFLAVWSRIALGSNHKYGTSALVLCVVKQRWCMHQFSKSTCTIARIACWLFCLLFLNVFVSDGRFGFSPGDSDHLAED